MRPLLPFLLLAVPLLAQEEDPKVAAAAIASKLSAPEDDVRIEGLREAAENQESSLVSPVTRLLKDKNPAVRTAAIEALALRQVAADRRRAAQALALRLKPLERNEEDADELSKVVQALHDLAQEVSIKPLLDMDYDEERAMVKERLMAVANVPSMEAVDRILQAASRGRRGHQNRRATAVAALRYATQADVSGGIDEWRQWWNDNKASFDPVKAAEKRAAARTEADEKQREKRNRREKRRDDE